MQPLFYFWLHNLPEWTAWPEQIRMRLEREAKRQFLIEMRRREETRTLLEKLAEKGINVLLLKGAAMGALYYPQPGLRPCEDTDILIEEKDREGIEAVMKALHFEIENKIEGEFVNSQFTWYREEESGILHSYDFHLKISNAQLFSKVFHFQELMRNAVRMPRLGPFALTLSPVEALLYSCMHRVAHHYDDEHAVWLYDIHLLAGQVDWQAFAELAREKRMRAVSLRGIRLAQKRFGTFLPENFEILLEDFAPEKTGEPAAAFLNEVKTPFGVLLSDLRALRSWRDRAQLLREHLFPSVPYMKRKYTIKSNFSLPFFYGLRIAKAFRHLLPRRKSSR